MIAEIQVIGRQAARAVDKGDVGAHARLHMIIKTLGNVVTCHANTTRDLLP